MHIYVELFEYRAAYESAEKAAIVYYKANDIIKFYDATLDVLDAGLVLNLEEYEQSIKIIQEGWEHLKDEQRARYYLIILSCESFQKKSRMLLEDYFRIAMGSGFLLYQVNIIEIGTFLFILLWEPEINRNLFNSM